MSDLTRKSIVSLQPVTTDNLFAILKLKVADNQRNFVAPNEISIAQAYFARETAWFRAIYADDTPVGFLMLADEPRKPEYFLWRLMVDQRYQGLGFGRKAVLLLIDYVKTRPQATELLVSYQPAQGNPGSFYNSLGFIETGQILDGEAVMRLPLEYTDDEEPAPAIGKKLTHVVMSNLKDTSPENVQAVLAKLRSLEGNVTTLRSIEVGVNVVHSDRAFDICLITRFDDLAGMEAYQVHPYHQQVLAFMRDRVAKVVAVDFESE